VYTDNNPLTYVLSSACLDATGQRWVAALASFNFNIKYRSGRENTDADILSRLPGLSSDRGSYQEVKPDVMKALCKNVYPSPYIESICMSSTISSIGDSDVLQSTSDLDLEVMNPREWRIRQREDPIIGVFLRSVTQKSKPDMTDALSGEAKYLLREFDHLVIRRGVLYRAVELNSEERLQLVLPVKWRDDAMRGAYYEVGHFGRSRGIAILRDRFYWPNMAADLDNGYPSVSGVFWRNLLLQLHH
jgi:hypothetical protein